MITETCSGTRFTSITLHVVQPPAGPPGLRLYGHTVRKDVSPLALLQSACLYVQTVKRLIDGTHSDRRLLRPEL